MDKAQKITVSIFAALLIIAIIAIIAVAGADKSPTVLDFVPPPFDENVKTGIPDPLPDSFGTLSISPELVVGLCALPKINDEEMQIGIFLTSHADNYCNIRLLVYAENGELLGESGLIKPGDHLPALELSSIPESGKPLRAVILSFEPDTYYSMGSAEVEIKPTA